MFLKMLPFLEIAKAGLMECHSLRELYTLPKTHFELHVDVDVTYDTVAQKMAWMPLGICEDEGSLARYDLDRTVRFLLMLSSNQFPPPPHVDLQCDVRSSVHEQSRNTC